MNFNELVEMMERTGAALRQRAARSIDRALVVRNWLLGRHIVEYEQNGLDRAQYGEKLIQRLADTLSARRRRGFSYRPMQLFKRFYLAYRGNLQTGSALSLLPGASPAAIVQSPSAQLSQGLALPNEAVLNNLAAGFALSWSHYGRVHREAKSDLAKCFVQRCVAFCAEDGSCALVTPQNWWFLTTYTKFRRLTDLSRGKKGCGLFWAKPGSSVKWGKDTAILILT
jgi:DUF1016 N-terminal domain